jgi:hypothetical protein
MNVNALDDGGSVRTQGTTSMPCSTSTISTTPTVAMVTDTPGSILPGNDFRRASSVLHAKTNAAICNINAPAAGKVVQINAIDLAAPTMGGPATIISVLKALLDGIILKPLLVFHVQITDNAQDRWIAKATVEPLLKQAATRIAAVVEAKRPTNRPTLKGLIHNDVDNTMEELRCRVQSLEAKLGETKVTKGKGAKHEMGGNKKSKKALGTVIPPSTITPKSKIWKAATKKKNIAQKQNSPASPTGNDNASNTASKNQGRRLPLASPVG